jgi:hypothetical protein
MIELTTLVTMRGNHTGQRADTLYVSPRRDVDYGRQAFANGDAAAERIRLNLIAALPVTAGAAVSWGTRMQCRQNPTQPSCMPANVLTVSLLCVVHPVALCVAVRLFSDLTPRPSGCRSLFFLFFFSGSPHPLAALPGATHVWQLERTCL